MQRVDEPGLREQLQRIGWREILHRDEPRERLVEDAEGVRLADAEVDRERGGRDEPAIEPWLRNAPFAIEE